MLPHLLAIGPDDAWMPESLPLVDRMGPNLRVDGHAVQCHGEHRASLSWIGMTSVRPPRTDYQVIRREEVTPQSYPITERYPRELPPHGLQERRRSY